MDCPEARKCLPGLALGDLDAEPAREVRSHAEACAPCRAELASLSSAAAALRGVDPLGTSAERRDAAVAAMARAHAEESERHLTRRRRPAGGVLAAAAALLVAALASLFLLTADGGPDFTVASLAGRADVFRSGSGLCQPLKVGDKVHPGDRVFTERESVVRFDFGGGRVDLDQSASLARVGGHRLLLERGWLFAELDGSSKPLVIADAANNTVSLRQGKLEAGLREVSIVVLGDVRYKDRPGVAGQASKIGSVRRLVARVAEGHADLGGAHQQRLRAVGGQEGSFDVSGRPGTSPAGGEIAPWRDRAR